MTTHYKSGKTKNWGVFNSNNVFRNDSYKELLKEWYEGHRVWRKEPSKRKNDFIQRLIGKVTPRNSPHDVKWETYRLL